MAATPLTTSGPPTGPNPLPFTTSDANINGSGASVGIRGRGRGGGGPNGGPRGRFVRGGPARGSFRPAGPAHISSGHDQNPPSQASGEPQGGSAGPQPGDGAYLLNRSAGQGGQANGHRGVNGDGPEARGQGRGGSRGRGGRGGPPGQPNGRDDLGSSGSKGANDHFSGDAPHTRAETPEGQSSRSRRNHPRSKKTDFASTSDTSIAPNTAAPSQTAQALSIAGSTSAMSRTSSRSSVGAGSISGGDGRMRGKGGGRGGGRGGFGRGGSMIGPGNQLRPESAAFVPAGQGQGNGQEGAAQAEQGTSQHQHPRSQSHGRALPPHMHDGHVTTEPPHHPHHVPPPKLKSSRKAAFGGKLTSDVEQTADNLNSEDEAQERAASGVLLNGGLRNGHAHASARRGVALGGAVKAEEEEVEVEKDDLTSRLTRGLSRKPFLECPICFAPLVPSQSIWSCLPTVSSSGASSTPAMLCCYTPFHLTCIADWSSRSLFESREKIRSSDRPEGVPLDDPSWRCPGCQKKRGDEVRRYECFCGAVKNLKHSGGIMSQHGTQGGAGGQMLGPLNASIVAPHSCGNQCRRKRSYCSHSCPLPCHAGPCPACIEQLIIPCPSHGTALAVKCSLAKGWGITSPTCAETCGRFLLCGDSKHLCAEGCHEGPCPPCDRLETALCYCGAEEKEVPCGWNADDRVACARDMDQEIVGEDEVLRWTGRFQCHRACQRLYDCGIHNCEEGGCHPHPLETLTCPSSPAVVTHCACGQTKLSGLDGPARIKCTDPIPTCDKTCPRPLSGCDHPCGKCHTGPCPPCMVADLPVPCRCGECVTKMVCSERKRWEVQNGRDAVFLCDRICRAQRNCLHHECGLRCCPLSYQAKSKSKRRDILEAILDDETSVHHCTLPCGKLLSCGVHPCPAQDHRGPCGRCLEASYEELICACGRTKLEPPIRCGTAMPDCSYPCHRPPPPCGHPKVPHTCHEDSSECPGCPYLMTKACQCGKATVKNVRCSSTTVSCGNICGRKLSCGGHLCKRSCHDLDEGCGNCTQVCGKNKRICGHPDQAVCHAPSACNEESVCIATVTLTCPCGNQQQRVSCGASTANPVSREKTSLKCTSECLLRQRNSRLAEALGIIPSEKVVEYPEVLKTFTFSNHAFVVTVEKAFSDFFLGPKQYHVLPHMPLAKRDFVLGLAGMYRFQTELVDADPQRSVAIRRRIDSRIPHPNISTVVVLAPPKRSLGGLVDLKKPGGLSSAPIRPAVSSPTPRAWSQPSTPRNFASLVATPAASASSSVRPSPSTSPKLMHERPRAAPTTTSHLNAYVPPHQRAPQGDDLTAPDWEEADE